MNESEQNNLDALDQIIQEFKEPAPEEPSPLEEKAQRHQSSRKTKDQKKLLFFLLLILFSAIFLFSTVYLAQYLIEQHRDEQEYDDLGDIVASIQGSLTEAPTKDPNTTEPDATEPPVTQPTEPGILPEYLPLYQMNSDMVGWVKLEGTNINYPVMQTPDSPDYYLDKNFNKQTSKAGAIYVREACDVFKPSDNVVIYGHYISSGQQMFTHLHKYTKKSFWKENQYIIFDTLYEHHVYQVFAVFKTSGTPGVGYPYHRFNDALDKADFDKFIDDVKDLSFYNTGITPQYGDKLITLSTCEYTLKNGRLVVVAVQVS